MPDRTRAALFFLLASILNFGPSSAQSGTADPQDDPARWKELMAGKSRIQFYGFARLDVIFDDSKPDNFQSILFINSEDSTLGPADQSNFTMYPRLTRFGMNFKGPQIAGLGSPKLGGNLEIDFQNGGRESRATPRIRHAYLKMNWNTVSVLAGQTWDLVSPLYPTVNNDTLQWNAGNLGDRRPQLRLSWDPKAGSGIFNLAGAAGLSGAIDSQDLDGNGVRDGEASGRPNLQARAGWAKTLSGDRKLAFGASGHYAWQEVVTPIAGKDTFRSHSIDVDWKIPFHARLVFQGEAWTGRNLADFRGGIGQAVNTAATDPALGEEIESLGGWAELSIKVGKSVTIAPGYSQDDPDDADVAASGRIKNRAAYAVFRYQPDPAFMAGIDLLRWRTDFEGLDPGVDNRINAYVVYNF